MHTIKVSDDFNYHVYLTLQKYCISINNTYAVSSVSK